MREKMTEEAGKLIAAVKEYSPKTGKVIEAKFGEMCCLGCSSTLEEKEPIMTSTASLLSEETANAKAYVEDLERLSVLAAKAPTLTCGGG